MNIPTVLPTDRGTGLQRGASNAGKVEFQIGQIINNQPGDKLFIYFKQKFGKISKKVNFYFINSR